MRFKNWVLSEAFQISRNDFYQVTRWLLALKANYGTNARPGTDITKGDFGVKTSDPQRLIRIFIWGLDQIREIENKVIGKQLPISSQELQTGAFDAKIVPTLKAVMHVVDSLLVNFQQVGYEHKNTEEVAKMLQKYRGNI